MKKTLVLLAGLASCMGPNDRIAQLEGQLTNNMIPDSEVVGMKYLKMATGPDHGSFNVCNADTLEGSFSLLIYDEGRLQRSYYDNAPAGLRVADEDQVVIKGTNDLINVNQNELSTVTEGDYNKEFRRDLENTRAARLYGRTYRANTVAYKQ